MAKCFLLLGVEFPRTWQQMETKTDFQIFKLSPRSAEYKDVEGALNKTHGGKVKQILEVDMCII